jgi:glycosyltransferase involved in cell wall biosynthesis
MVVVEAMASGRPVVASNRGGIPEAVCDGVTGILADPDRPPAFTKALLGLIREPARAHALGEAGRMRAVEKFSPERVYERTRSLHDAVRARASGRADLRWTAKWLPN